MPWTVDDVDRFKSGLTDTQKRQWVAIANSALARCEEANEDDCDAKAIRQANGAVSASESYVRPLLFAADQEWISFLPRPGTYEHAVYGQIDLPPERISRIVANFQNHIYGQTLPINAEHDMKSSGAVGWITDMRVASDGSIEVKPEWNDRGRALLDADRFRYVSAEWYDEWQDPVSGTWHEDIANGLAICTKPYFKTDVLRPLAASEEAAMALQQKEPIRWTGEGEPEQMQLNEDDPKEQPTEAPAPAPEPVQPPEEPPMPEPDIIDEPKDEPKDDATSRELTEQTVKEFHEMRRELNEARKELAQTQAALALSNKERLHKKFTDEVIGHSEGNDIPWVGDIQSNVQFLMSLSEKFGEESSEMNWHIGDKRAAALIAKKSALFNEMGTGRTKETMTPQDQIELLAKRFRDLEPSLSKEQAYSKALAENPDLYEQSLA